MNHHSSYSAPRSERSLSGGSSYSPRGGRNKKRNSYPKRSWKDNREMCIRDRSNPPAKYHGHSP